MIKLIATDMDGTWLTDQKTYDEELFLREFQIMQERGIKFVVASGNQYENLYSRFPQVARKLYYVAENGALVAHGRQVIHVDSLSAIDWQTILEISKHYREHVTVSGLASAYCLNNVGSDFIQEMKKYFEKLTPVPDFDHLDDRIFKATFEVAEEKMPQMLDQLQEDYPQIGFVAGSSTSIDMSTKGMNKAVGLKYLAAKFNISSKEMVAFGDSGNDVGMLNYVGRSYATATALPSAKKAADRVIGSSNDSAVQKEIWHLLTS